MTPNSPNATAAESAIRQIGTEFRRLRGLRGERIEDIATYLDIKPTYLFGIEQGDLSVIPSKREAKSMVRSYANYLGLDDEGILSPMEPIITSLEGDNAPLEPTHPSWFDRTSATILSTSVVLGVLVGWSWIGDVNQFDLITPPVTADSLQYEGDDIDVPEDSGDVLEGREDFGDQSGDAGEVDGDAADVFGDVRDEGGAGESSDESALDTTLVEEDLSGEAAEAADALLAELKTVLEDSAETIAEGGDEAVPAGDGSESERIADPANVLAALVAERGDGAHIYEAENTDARVIVRALANVTVQVTSQARDYVWTKSMKPREMLLVPNRDDLELWTGDAARVEILLDGTILPPLGPADTVISGLSLSASSLEAISAALPENGSKPTF